MDLSQFFSTSGAVSGVIFGAIAGAVSAEIRDRLKENRSKNSCRKALCHAFYCQIEKDCSIINEYRKSLSRRDLLSCLNTCMWQDKQIDISNYIPELSDHISDYYRALDMFIAKLAYEPNTNFPVHVSIVSAEDVDKITQSGEKALKTLRPFVSKP